MALGILVTILAIVFFNIENVFYSSVLNVPPIMKEVNDIQNLEDDIFNHYEITPEKMGKALMDTEGETFVDLGDDRFLILSENNSL